MGAPVLLIPLGNVLSGATDPDTGVTPEKTTQFGFAAVTLFCHVVTAAVLSPEQIVLLAFATVTGLQHVKFTGTLNVQFTAVGAVC
jgi:hypothetical protein